MSWKYFPYFIIYFLNIFHIFKKMVKLYSSFVWLQKYEPSNSFLFLKELYDFVLSF